MMNHYLERAGLSCDSPLFCQLVLTKCGYKRRTKGLSYSRLRDLVQEAVIIKILYGIFLLFVRILLGEAGLLLPQMLACQTVSSSVMPAGLAGESAKDGYVKDSLSSHLSVSEALGI